jgi:hypothetical protein
MNYLALKKMRSKRYVMSKKHGHVYDLDPCDGQPHAKRLRASLDNGAPGLLMMMIADNEHTSMSDNE